MISSIRSLSANAFRLTAGTAASGKTCHSFFQTVRGVPCLQELKTVDSAYLRVLFQRLSFSSKVQTQQRELVKVITLNNICDNPGAVKTVRWGMHSILYRCGYVHAHFPFKTVRLEEWVEESVHPRERHQGEVIKVKNRVLVVARIHSLKVVRLGKYLFRHLHIFDLHCSQ